LSSSPELAVGGFAREVKRLGRADLFSPRFISLNARFPRESQLPGGCDSASQSARPPVRMAVMYLPAGAPGRSRPHSG
jgi:hypothetical protein